MQGSITKHGLFGKVRLVHKYIGTAMEYECQTKTREEAIRWDQLHKANATLNTNNLLMPIETSKNSTGQYCNWKLVFGDYFYVLDHERGNRQINNDHFTESELWYLLYNMVEASKNLSQVGLHLGVPCGDTILLNQYGNIQILCQLSSPNCRQIIATRKLTLSPEQLQAKNNATLIFGLDRTKSQAFNIGMTIIELGTLRRAQKIYDNNEVKWSQIFKMLEQFSRRYSVFLTRILGSMVRLDILQRSSTGQIWSALLPYESKINGIQKFDPSKDQSQNSLKSYLKTHYKVN